MIPDLTIAERLVFSLAYSDPGLCVRDLARRASVPQASADLAVLHLERSGLLRTEKRAYPATQGSPPIMRRHCYPAPWTVN